MESRIAIEAWPRFDSLRAKSFLSRRVKKGSAGRVGLGILCMITDSTFLSKSFLEGHCSLIH